MLIRLWLCVVSVTSTTKSVYNWKKHIQSTEFNFFTADVTYCKLLVSVYCTKSSVQHVWKWRRQLYIPGTLEFGMPIPDKLHLSESQSHSRSESQTWVCMCWAFFYGFWGRQQKLAISNITKEMLLLLLLLKNLLNNCQNFDTRKKTYITIYLFCSILAHSTDLVNSLLALLPFLCLSLSSTTHKQVDGFLWKLAGRTG